MSTTRRKSQTEHPLERLRYLLEMQDMERMPTAELARRLHVSQAQLTLYFQVLVTKGFLTTDTTQSERTYQLTPQGRAFLKSYERIQQVLEK